MAIDKEKYQEIIGELGETVQLVAVSKTKPVEDIRALYDLGQRDFGENYVQELVDKHLQLPPDLRWHFIGHLQSNKVRSIAPFVHLIHGVDSARLLREISKQGARCGRTIDCLLQVHIAAEETKFGLDAEELSQLMAELTVEPSVAGPAVAGSPVAVSSDAFKNVRVRGLMGMASFTDDPEKVRGEFRSLKSLFDRYFPSPAAPVTAGPHIAASAAPLAASPPSPAAGDRAAPILSMGMSGDYKIALAEGSNTVRIGSLLFGKRNYV